MAIDPYQRVSWRGVTVNQRTKEMVQITELRALRSLTPLGIPQGSYNAGGVSASGGTHDGGGVVDISVRDMTVADRDRVVRELRETSFAAWYRTPLPGVWPAHIHAVAIGDKELSPQAAWQVSEYRVGRNGLANQGSDNGPQVPIHVYRQDIDMSYYGYENWDDDDKRALKADIHGSGGGTAADGPYVNLASGNTRSTLQKEVQYAHKAADDSRDNVVVVDGKVVALAADVAVVDGKIDLILGHLGLVP